MLMRGETLNDTQSTSIRELVLAAQGGDQATWKTLVEACMLAVVRWAHGLVPPGDVPDIAQQALFNASRSLKSLREPERFYAWLKSITIHCAFEFLRKREPSTPRESKSLTPGCEFIDPTAGPEEQFLRRELRIVLTGELVRLTEQGRITKRECVVCMRMLLGESMAEIAADLEISEPTVRVHKQHVIMRLRNAPSIREIWRLWHDLP